MTLLPLQIAGVVLVVVTLPLLAELFVLTVAALVPVSRKSDECAGSGTFFLTVVIPAHNEEALIGRCVRSLMASAADKIDILVVAHNCTDSTAAEAEAAGARVLALNDSKRAGKGYALNAGFAAALTGPTNAVLVVDADSVACPQLVEGVRNRLMGGASVVQCRYEVENSLDSWRTNVVTLAFRAFNVVRPRGRSRLGLSSGVFGNGFALHRDVLARIPYNAYSIVEDLQYHLDLVRAGYRVEYLDAFSVRGEMPISSAGAESQRARWEGGRLQMLIRSAPHLLTEILRGRIRLLEPLLDLLALSITSEICFLLLAACLPLPWLRFYVSLGFAVLILHVGTAAAIGPKPFQAISALVSAPIHILWKLSILPETWRASRAQAVWVRTKREGQSEGKKSERRFRTNPVL
jgi:cellulose synthase/poly-beta-1,6-N-acetylglucosamine synthase-like glycosyltransferase